MARRTRRVIEERWTRSVVDLRQRGRDMVVDGGKLRVMVVRRGRQRVVGQRSRYAVKGSERGRVVLCVVLSVVRRILARMKVVHRRVVVAVR
jgi:hypothetical protein